MPQFNSDQNSNYQSIDIPMRHMANGIDRRKTQFDIPETSNSSNIIREIPNNVAFDLLYLKDRIRQLEKASLSRKKSSTVVLVAASNDDDEDKAIDGTCSARCMKYFVDLVSIVGIKEIYRAKHPIVKGLWCITFILSVVITLFYLNRSIASYFEEPTATKVKIVRQDKYEYPVMLLCPDIWLDYPKALRLNASRAALQYALGYLINYSFRAPSFRISDFEKAKNEFDDWYESRNYGNLVELFKDVAMDSELFLYKCPYCQYRNFSKVLMDETICYKIPMYWMTGKGTARSSTDILEVTIPDRSGGLLHKKKYWRLYVEPDLSIGISTVRFVQVFPGFSNTIRFTPVRYLSINKPDDPCVPARPGYSTVGCALACANKANTCKQIGALRQDTIMHNLTDLCHHYPLNVTGVNTEEKIMDMIPDHCFEECPPLCERWMYEASVESHKISSYVPISPSDTDNGTKSDPVPMTRIYLLNQAPLQGGYMEFKEVSTYSFDAMIGNIGGIMSLWLGASIMSFIQIVVFFLTWCFARHLNNKNTNAAERFEDEISTSYISNGDFYSNHL